MKDKLSIVIPCKNEALYIEDTLLSLNSQIGIEDVDVIIADARSTDSTLEIVDRLVKSGILKYRIHLIHGGRPSAGRNRGAYYIQKDYILFIDADTTLPFATTLYFTYSLLDGSNGFPKFDLVTCNFESRSESYISKLAFKLFNFFRIHFMKEPFAVGAYFATSREAFIKAGGFDETVMHTEDYLLSRKYDPLKFAILTSLTATQDDRRFKKMGYFRFLWMLVTNYINRNNIDHFRKDIKYW